LVATWGNLVNRALSMTQRYCDGRIPDPGELTEQDTALLTAVDEAFHTAGALYDACKFRAAMQDAMAAATRVNQYLEETSPWTTVKTDPTAAHRALYVTLQALNGLKLIFAPALPFTSQTLHELLGEEGRLFGEQLVETYQEEKGGHTALTYDGRPAVGVWERKELPIGRLLPKPRPLFKKLEPALADEELARLGMRR
jgi:methionyl-tRNA synthetase